MKNKANSNFSFFATIYKKKTVNPQEKFNEIINEFRDKINEFLYTNDFDEYSIIVQLKNDKSKTPITTMGGEVIGNNAFLHDTDFMFCQDTSKSS